MNAPILNAMRAYLARRDFMVIDKALHDRVFSDFQLSAARNQIRYSLKSLPEAFVSVYEGVKDYTMTPPERLYSFCDAADYVARENIPGAIVECGTWLGGGMMGVARWLQAQGREPRDLYLCDTFAGHPKPDAKIDIDIHGVPAIRHWEKFKVSETESNWAVAEIEAVRANMASTGYSPEHMHFVKGRVEDTLPAGISGPVSILRIDTDWYASIIHIMRALYDRIPVGGVLIFDDYGHFAGARQAVDDFYAERGEKPLLVRTDYSCCTTIKR